MRGRVRARARPPAKRPSDNPRGGGTHAVFTRSNPQKENRSCDGTPHSEMGTIGKLIL